MGSITIDDYFGKKVPASYSDGDPLLCPPLDPKFKVNPGGLGVVLIESMKKYENNVAHIMAETGASMTYGEVLLNSIRVAQKMKRIGITPDDIISFCTGNHINSCLPYLACFYLGVRVASLDPSIPLNDSKYLLSIVKPKIVFCGMESEKMIEQALLEEEITADIVVFGHTTRNIPFLEFLEETNEEDNFEAVPVNNIYDTAAIFFSSGTTGYPKGICVTHYGLLLQGQLYGSTVGLGASLFFTTFYWISAVMMLISAISYGGTRILSKGFNENTTMKYVEKYKVTLMFLAPTLVHRFTRNPETCDYDTRSLKYVFIGGGPIGEKPILTLRKLLPHSLVTLMYGMTEFAGVATMFNVLTEIDLINAKPLSSGRPVSGFSYKIVDPETEEILGPNQRGELRIKTKTVMAGYYNRPEETKKAWDKDGYLHTGDIAYYDEDYCFYIVDRIKDMLKYQSWHVAPAEIESVISTHPDVKACVVIGMPHEEDGDLPMGVVVLKPDAVVSEEELNIYANDRLSERKKLRAGIKFVESIPLTPTGKLRRRDVRNWVINNII